ncbi:MAG: quinone oxidoreductase [Nitriliruptor sp.]|nr:MAG: quinone oxidoreductase [Nitriliruptor sp.]
MDAIQLETHGGPEVLQIARLADPEPRPDEVLVRVAAAGVNFIDTYQRSGLYDIDVPGGLGLEGAGEVVALGAAVTNRQVGDLVAWADTRGSYAELVCVPAGRSVRVPTGVEPEQAAALMLQGMTAHYLTHSTRSLRAGETVLAFAAAGGVGRLLVQLAVRRGARVIAATSTPEKASEVRALGAEEVLLYREVDVAQAVRELTGGEGVDVVYDSVGKTTFESSLRSLKPRGLLVLYGASSGPVPPVDLQVLNRHGSLFATRPSLTHYVATTEELEWRASSLFDLVRTDALDLQIHDRYPLAEAARAHTDLESGTTTGKLLLLP